MGDTQVKNMGDTPVMYGIWKPFTKWDAPARSVFFPIHSPAVRTIEHVCCHHGEKLGRSFNFLRPSDCPLWMSSLFKLGISPCWIWRWTCQSFMMYPGSLWFALLRLQPALGPCPNIRWDDATLILWTLRGQSAGINPTPYIDPKGTYINPRKTQSKVYIMEYMWSVARVPHLHSIRVSTIDQVPVWHARLQFRRNATSLGHDASGMWFRAKHWVFSGKPWMDT